MKPFKDIEKQYWEKYLRNLPIEDHPVHAYVEASYAGNREATDKLLHLYLTGKKIAGSSILEDFLSVGDLPPKTGSHWILLNGKDEPGCILRTDRIELN